MFRARTVMMRALPGVVAAVLSLPLSPLEAQSDMAFPAHVYAARRARLAEMTRHAAIIVPGRHLVGAHELPKQDPNFWYLTGVESAYAILVMAPDRRAIARPGDMRVALFLPDSFQFVGAQYPMADSGFRRASWNQPLRRLAPGHAAAAAVGITETYPIDSFAVRAAEIIGASPAIYLPMPADSLYSPPGLPRPLTTEQQFVRGISTFFPGRELRDVIPLVRGLRLVKDQFEIGMLRRAADISALSMRWLMRVARPGMNDLTASGILESEFKRLGAQRTSFAPIVGSGPNAMTFFTVRGENYNAVDRVMADGDLLFVDYGAAEFRTYASDICRTIPVSGQFTPEQRKYYDIVLEAQDAAIARVRPGGMMLDAIKAAAEVFRKHGLERYEDVATMGPRRVWGVMPSPTHYLARDAGITRYSRFGSGVRDIGHHVGLEATDSRDWSIPFAAGMVVTIEPKLYIPEKNIAIMIEDMVLVTATGHEVLSVAAPRRAADIEAEMRYGRTGKRP